MHEVLESSSSIFPEERKEEERGHLKKLCQNKRILSDLQEDERFVGVSHFQIMNTFQVIIKSSMKLFQGFGN